MRESQHKKIVRDVGSIYLLSPWMYVGMHAVFPVDDLDH